VALAHLPGHLNAIDSTGQHHIGEQQVDGLGGFLTEPQGFRAISGGQEPKADLRQNVVDKTPDGRLIFD
jgi:hypothetical protein